MAADPGGAGERRDGHLISDIMCFLVGLPFVCVAYCLWENLCHSRVANESILQLHLPASRHEISMYHQIIYNTSTFFPGVGVRVDLFFIF